jgi:hypothetical protein
MLLAQVRPVTPAVVHASPIELTRVGARRLPSLLPMIPGYQFTGGVTGAYRGVELLIEDGCALPVEQVAEQLARLIDASPANAVAQLHHVTVRARQDEGYDRYYSKAYRIPDFHAAAASGYGASTYFGGEVHSPGTFFHELGHQLDVGGGEWHRAMAADDAVIGRLLATGSLEPNQLGPIEPDPARRERWTPRLAPGAVTGYADKALGEEVAESLRLRTIERWFHEAIATYVDRATGARRPVTFDELYPARAALLERIAGH